MTENISPLSKRRLSSTPADNNISVTRRLSSIVSSIVSPRKRKDEEVDQIEGGRERREEGPEPASPTAENNASVTRRISSLVSSIVSPLKRRDEDHDDQIEKERDDEARARSDSVASSIQDIDVTSLNQSLAYVNPFLYKRIAEKNQYVLMKELLSDGAADNVQMQLRQLLSYVNQIADFIDSKAARKYEAGIEGKLSIVDIFNDEENRFTHVKLPHPLGTVTAAESSKSVLHEELPVSFLNPHAHTVNIRHLIEVKLAKNASDAAAAADAQKQQQHTHKVPKKAVTSDSDIEEKDGASSSLLSATGHAQSDKVYASKGVNFNAEGAAVATVGEVDGGIKVKATTNQSSSGKELHQQLLHDDGGGGGGNEADTAVTGVSAAINLRVRDLRRLDFIFHPSQEPSVWVRRHAVLFCLDPIRAIVMASRIIIIMPQGGMDQIMQILERYMREWSLDDTERKLLTAHRSGRGANVSGRSNKQHSRGDSGDQDLAAAAVTLDMSESVSLDIPFEAHAYEAILTTVNTLHSQEFKRINDDVQHILKYFHGKSGSILPYSLQERMRNLKNSVSLLQARVASMQRALNELIEDDEAMALMNLTKLRNNPALYRTPLNREILSAHEEIEELLEAYLMDCNALEGKLAYLLVTMQNAEDLLMLKLDTSRNELLVANTSLTVCTVAVGFGAYVTGIFGQNLDQTVWLLPINGVFIEVCALTGAIIVFGTIGVILYLRWTGVLPKTLKIDPRLLKKWQKQ